MKRNLWRLVVTNFEGRYGIPVYFDEKLDTIAMARGFWPNKRIVVGLEFLPLQPDVQHAVLLHEAAHCIHLHLERRLCLLPFCWAKWALRRALAHEHEADAFVVGEGYAQSLLSFIGRVRGEDSGKYIHPSVADRVEYIQKLMRESIHVAKAA